MASTDSPPPKKSKKSYSCSYKKDWEKTFPIRSVSKEPNSFFCMPCSKKLSCAKMGKRDVERHCDPSLTESIHNKNVKAAKTSTQIPFSSLASTSKHDSAVIRAEVMQTEFLVQHNISLNVADHLSKFYARAFPDSKIAKSFRCGRTKSTCILNNALAPDLKDYIVEHMLANPFSLVNDGSNDNSVKKMNATCAMIFDVNRSKKVELRFFGMCSTSGENCSKAETLFNAIDGEMSKAEINWDNCVSVGVDNTNTNVGERNSIKSRVRDKNKATYIAGCNCHLAHLAAGCGGKAFAEVTGFDAEDHQVDLYYYFKKSTRRKGILQEYVDFVGEEYDEIIRFVKTRWLSLELCCSKELKKYEGLRSMFESRPNDSSKEDTGEEEESKKSAGARFKRLKKSFTDPMTEAHLQFFSTALPLFTSYNLFLQRADPLAHLVYPMTKDLIQKIAKRFLKHEVLSELTLESLEDGNNYLPLEDIHIGLSCITILADLREGRDGDYISKKQYEDFLFACQSFYKASLQYVMKKMDTNNEFWENATWINFFQLQNATWANVKYFVTRYSKLLNFTETEFNLLYDQFFDYKSLLDSDVNLEEAKLHQGKARNDTEGEAVDSSQKVQYRMDTIWHQLQEKSSPIGDDFRFRLLFRVASIVLITPHSNAGIERVYSLVNKNKPEGSDRNRMDIDGTLTSIVGVKLGRPESETCCYQFDPSKKVLDAAKKATKRYNDEHCKK